MLRLRPVVRSIRFNSTIIPKHDLTPAEERDVNVVDSISGAPESLQHRMVRIYRPAKTSMQSGIQGTKLWKLDWDTLEKDNRWTNPLMGWASSGDAMQGTALQFATQEDAIRFAERQGWDYFIQTPHQQEFHPKSYSSNFTRTQMNPKKSIVSSISIC